MFAAKGKQVALQPYIPVKFGMNETFAYPKTKASHLHAAVVY